MAQIIDIAQLVRGSERINREKTEIKIVLSALIQSLQEMYENWITEARSKGSLFRTPVFDKEFFRVRDDHGNLIICEHDGGINLKFVPLDFEIDTREFFGPRHLPESIPTVYVGTIYAMLPSLVAKIVEVCPGAETWLNVFYKAAKRS